MKKLLFVLAVLISIAVCAGMTSCKAWRTISTTATYTQVGDSTKTTTTISRKRPSGRFLRIVPFTDSQIHAIVSVDSQILRHYVLSIIAAQFSHIRVRKCPIISGVTDEEKYGIRCRANRQRNVSRVRAGEYNIETDTRIIGAHVEKAPALR